MAKHLDDNVGLRENRVAVGEDFGALVLILGIRVTCALARSGLDHHLEPCLGKHRHNYWRQCNAPLSWIKFFGNSNDHEVCSFPPAPAHTPSHTGCRESEILPVIGKQEK